MSDDLRPGEIDLEAPAPEPVPPAEPAADPPAEPVAEPEAPAEPAEEPNPSAADPPPAQERKHTGAVAELIEKRAALKERNQRLSVYENDPAIQRLTPELRAAIVEGRVVVQPPKANGDTERERLAQVATDLGLFKADNTPDVEAAGRVDRYVRGTVKAAVEPVRNLTLADKAVQNINVAVQHATATMTPEAVAIVQEEFSKVYHQPNGPQMLSQAQVAKTVWRQAMGRLVDEGKLTPKAAAAAPAPKPPVIASDGTGRRSPGQASITLSAAAQRVYKDHGLDPAKGFSSRANLSNPGAISLED